MPDVTLVSLEEVCAKLEALRSAPGDPGISAGLKVAVQALRSLTPYKARVCGRCEGGKHPACICGHHSHAWSKAGGWQCEHANCDCSDCVREDPCPDCTEGVVVEREGG